MDHKQSYTANKLSHAYIVSGTGENALEQARNLASAMMCQYPEQAPCGHCENCRKIREGIHPDLGHVTREVENGKQKKSIRVRQIRDLIADAYVLPNEAGRKVYIIEDADTMNPQAQNAFLKLLEEPPSFDAFILVAANPMLLLPTVRSRCVLIRTDSEEEELSAEEKELARGFLNTALRGSEATLFQWCMEHNSMNVQETLRFLDAVKETAVSGLSDSKRSLTQKKKIDHLIRLADRCREFLAVNTGPKHVMAYLAVNANPDRKEHS